MELTNNSFGKGMLLDTNPMLQGNDSLSECLNGTFLTQNGNELILQNDMGNRKVKDTYLPEGYIPVGIKEYGGIIYIASYNPLTNKGQIGSFPAPELWIDNDENTDTDINFIFLTSEDPTMQLKVVSNNTEKFYNFRYLIESLKIYKITDNLHIGDLFAFFYDGEELKPLQISLYGDKNDTKNRKYSLNIGILNSQNVFLDITKDLVWTNSFGLNGNIYFVTKNKLQNINKNKIAYNLFSNKTTGPLALKITQNIPDYIVPTITGSLNNDANNTANLLIELLITHNCPINKDNKYFYFLTKIPKNIDLNLNDNICWNNISGNIECIVEENPTKLVMKCLNVLPTREGYLLDYFIAVPSVFNTKDIENESNKFKIFLNDSDFKNEGLLKQFCFQGTLDYRLFSTYSMNITQWLFSTINNSTTLNCSVDVITQSSDLKVRIVCKEVSNDGKTIIIPLTQGELTKGKYPYSVSNYTLPNTTYGEAYTATIELLDLDNNVLSTINDYWILCTTLFNGANDSVNNDNYVGDNYVHPTEENLEAAQLRLLTIDINLDDDMVLQDFIDDNLTISGSLYKIEYRESEQEGQSDIGTEEGLIPETLTEDHELNYKYTPRMDIKLNTPKYTISNNNKYPNYITNSNIIAQLNNSALINTDAEVTFVKKVGNEWINTNEVKTIEDINIAIGLDGFVHLTGKFLYEEKVICKRLKLYEFNEGVNLILLKELDEYFRDEHDMDIEEGISKIYVGNYGDQGIRADIHNLKDSNTTSIEDWDTIYNTSINWITRLLGEHSQRIYYTIGSDNRYIGVTENGIPIEFEFPAEITNTSGTKIISSILKNFDNNKYYCPSIKFLTNSHGVFERKKSPDDVTNHIYERCYVYGFDKNSIDFNRISDIMMCTEDLVIYNGANISDNILNIFKFNVNSKLDINFGNKSALSITYIVNDKWNPNNFLNSINYLVDTENGIYANLILEDTISRLSNGIFKLSNGELTSVSSLLKFVDNNGNLNFSIESNFEELENYILENYIEKGLVEKEEEDIYLRSNAWDWNISTGQSYIIKQFIANE